MILRSSDVIACLCTTDLGRARQFYAGTLGLELIEENDYACVLDAHGTMLRVAAASHVATPGYTVLGWRVGDIDTAVAELAAAGVVFQRFDGLDQDEHGVWTAPGGDRVVWFADPDGNVLSLTHFR